MSIARRIAKNTTWLYGAEVIGKILQFFLIITLARHYGAEIFGQYSFAMTFTLIFSMFVDLGMGVLIIREISKNRASTPKYLKNILFIKLVLAFVSFFLLVVVINILNYPKDVTLLVYAFGIYNSLMQIVEFFKAILKAHEHMFSDSIIKVFEKVITVGVSLVLIYLGYSIKIIALVFLFSAICTVLMSIAIISKSVSKFTANLDTHFIKRFLRASITFALLLVFYT